MWSRRPISGVPAGPQSRQAQLALTLWTCGLALALPTSLGARGQALPLSNPRDLLATEPGAFARLLETARPTPVSAGEKARILSSLPETGEITNLNAQTLHKLAALSRVLRATDSVYVIKVIAVPQAAIGLHGRAVLLISETALTLLGADELQAMVAHEIGHEYVWLEYDVPSGCRPEPPQRVGARVRRHRHRHAARSWNGSVSIDGGCGEDQPIQQGTVWDGQQRGQLSDSCPSARLRPSADGSAPVTDSRDARYNLGVGSTLMLAKSSTAANGAAPSSLFRRTG